LVEAVELTLARCRAEIRKGAAVAFSEERKAVEPLSIPTEFVSVENWKPALDACFERERITRQAQRLDRYDQVVALRAQGLGSTEIAQRVGLWRRTIDRWLKAEAFPESKRRRKRRSKFDPYAAHVHSRWEEGCHTGLRLYQEIKAQGYTGSERMLYRFLVPLRSKERMFQKADIPHAPLQDLRAA
jgi:transposase